MHHANRIHRQRHESEPNLFDFIPKNVWREVYRGRWAELRTVQKVEFIVEIVFWSLFIGSFAYSSYRGGHVLGLILAFGVVWVVLGGFFFLMTRYL
jgi:hypothetical protein